MSARVYSDSVMVWEKNGEPVQGLDVSRWSEKRVQVDFSNRLVFYSLKKEDEGHYRCIVDLELAAMYHVEVKEELMHRPELEPYLGYLKFVYCFVVALFSFVWIVRFMHRHRRVRAGRSVMARRWNKLGWRPEAVVKYLFKRKSTAGIPLNFTDKDVDDADDDDDDDDDNNNNNNVNVNAGRQRRQRDNYNDDLSSVSSDSSTDVSIQGIYTDYPSSSDSEDVIYDF